MLNKKIIILFAMILLVGIVSPAVETIGTAQQNACIDLLQSGAGFTECNVTSVKFPINRTLAMDNMSMQKDGTEYNLTFCSTTVLGEYIVNGLCSNGTEIVVWAYAFDVTYSGGQMTSSNSIFYVVLFGTFMFLFFITLFGINKLPSSNATDPDEKIIKISYLKYFRSVLYFVLWVFILAILFITSNLAFAYLPDTLAANFFYVLWRVGMGLTLPMIVVWLGFIIAQIIDDKKIKALWNRGMFPQTL